ncbi:MAG: cobyrinate a,c-diamide synthase [Spirochaetes bacterium]|nr:cobyrinate a,c-diamide synthase [Spirochaetota bacterium]
MKKIIFAGTGSGSGKTTISTAIMRVFTDRGKKVAPFKTGPDFIDPKFHAIASRSKSWNLDTALNDIDTVKYLFQKNSKDCDIAIIEGVMGLYDGCGFDQKGSTAELSLILKAPVVLIVDAKAISESICAVILGFKLYNPEVNIKGVILNNIHDKNYYNSLKELIIIKTGIQCLGYFPINQFSKLNERHLGLIPVEEQINIEEYFKKISGIAAETIDMDLLEKIAEDNRQVIEDINLKFPENIGKNLRIGIARDKAFNFYYEDNLSLMKETGIDLVEFSPMEDKKLPDGINGLYIGGGFPEIFTRELSENKLMLVDIYNKLENSMPCYAECGGLMYLTKCIKDMAGNSYNTVGFFNVNCIMTTKLQRFGYVDVEYEGITTRAHEFHYSELEFEKENNFVFKYNIKKIKDNDQQWNCGLLRKNVLAAYPHVHFYSNFIFFIKIVELFRRNLL